MEENINTTIDEQLTILEETKTQIKQAIIDKGQTITDNDSFRSYVSKINNIEVLNAQEKTVTPTSSQQIIEPDDEYNALSQVTVEAVDYEDLGTLTPQEYNDALDTAEEILRHKYIRR